MSQPLILASGSASRHRLLEAAGVEIVIDKPSVDESAVKESLAAEGASVRDAAIALAEVKARQIALRRPDALVLGADQMLDCDEQWLDKPGTAEAVADHLRLLAGKSHRLTSAAVICQGNQRVWHSSEEAWLAMRPLSPEFIAGYVAAYGEAVCSSVGGYHLEAAGAQLFTRVTGDHFVVQGLPLLAILGFLRDRGMLPA
ncbi:MAG: Maf family protein [Pseudomonadota bacterium]